MEPLEAETNVELVRAPRMRQGARRPAAAEPTDPPRRSAPDPSMELLRPWMEREVRRRPEGARWVDDRYPTSWRGRRPERTIHAMFRSHGSARRVAPIFVLLPLWLGLSSPAWAGRSVQSWNERLQATVSQLREGRWAEGKASAQAGLEDLGRFLAPGDKAGSAVAMFLMCRAVAEAGLGEEREAIWDWQVAQQLDARLETWSLTEFGSAGRFLDGHRLRGASEAVPAPPKCDGAERLTPPVKVRARSPRNLEGAWSLKRPVHIEIEIEIGVDGVPRGPRIVDRGPLESVTWAASDAMRDWRFEPARRDGEPVACASLLTFDLRFTR